MGASAKTSSFSMSAVGAGRLTLAPGKVADVTVLAHIAKAVMDCSGTKECACASNDQNPTQ